MIKHTLALLLLPLALTLAAPVRADVPTVRVEARPVTQTHPIEATLEAVRQATLAAQVPGRVVALTADAGDRVSQGAVLVRIEASAAAEAVAAADAVLAQARANLANAEAAYERARTLTERKFVSSAALDQARAAYDAASAQVRAARAARGQAAAQQAHATIVAPFSGLIAARHVEPGEMAQPGRALLTVYDPAAMRAVVDVPQQRLAGLSAGQMKAHVELPDSGRWLEAAAVTILPAADPRTHTVRLRVDLPAVQQGLVPGMFARVHFATGEASRIVVPAEAILRRGELTGVYVADGDGGFRLRQVRVGEPGPDGNVEVLAGLVGGEEVALDPVRAGIAARAARPRGQ